jgi:hypothetical protein
MSQDGRLPGLPTLTEGESVRYSSEPRSGDRFIAWGVSPRYRGSNKWKAPEGRQICRRSAAVVFLLMPTTPGAYAPDYSSDAPTGLRVK